MIKGFDIITTGKIANICGAFCVSKKGAITALPKERDVLKILKRI
jgi:sugar/nucleoside kinase (ribokinase family)